MPRTLSTAQVKVIRAIAHGRLSMSNEDFHHWLTERGGPASTLDLSSAQAANVIDMLKAMADGTRVLVWRVDQATLRQRGTITGMLAALPSGRVALPGIIQRVTRGRVAGAEEVIAQLTISEAGRLIEALQSIRGFRRQPTRQFAR